MHCCALFNAIISSLFEEKSNIAQVADVQYHLLLL